MLQDVQVPDVSAVPTAASGPDPQPSSPSDSNQESHDAQSADQEGEPPNVVQQPDAPINNKHHDLGTIVIPEHKVEGLEATLAYTSTFRISDASLFDQFLRDLMTEGEAKWLIVGHPGIKYLGIVYQGSKFEKQMTVRGPRLRMAGEKGLRDSEDETSKIEPQQPQPQQLQQPVDPSHECSRHPRSSTDGSNQVPISILSADLSSSTSTEAHLSCKVQLNNQSGQSTVDPVGSVKLELWYLNEKVMIMASDKDTTLKPVREGICTNVCVGRAVVYLRDFGLILRRCR